MDLQPFKMVVGVDFSPLGIRALDEAICQTALHDNCEIHAVHMDLNVPEPGVEAYVADLAMEKLAALCRERAEAAQQAGWTLNLARVVTHFRLGRPAYGIVQLAVDIDADLILVGTHGRHGLQRLVMGSVAQKVLELARCPVFVLRSKAHQQLEDAPEITPPCPDCIAKQEATKGDLYWCPRHRERRYVADQSYDV